MAIQGRWVPRDIPSAEFGPAYRPAKAPIEFKADGTWIGRSGPCNPPMSGTYQLSGSRIRVAGPERFIIGSECLGGVVSYGVLLSAARHARIVDDRLELLDAHGNLVVGFDPAK